MIAPLKVHAHSELGQIRNQAYEQKSDDLLGCVESVKFTLAHGLLTLPVDIVFPDPPDVLISSKETIVAVEVRRVAWTRMSEVTRAAKPGEVVELTPELCVDRPARRDKRAAKGTRSGDYLAIKSPGEHLDAPGWLGDRPEATMLAGLSAAIEDKDKKFASYSKHTSHVWLFLIDDGLPFSWGEIRADQIDEICSKTNFERIFLFDFTHGLSTLYAVDS